MEWSVSVGPNSSSRRSVHSAPAALRAASSSASGPGSRRPLPRRGVAQHEPLSRPRGRPVQSLGEHPPGACLVVGGQRLGEERVRHRLGHRHRHPGPEAENVDVVGLDAPRVLERHHLDRGGLGELGFLPLAQAEIGHGGDRAGELAGCRLRAPADVGRRQLAELGERAQALGDVGAGREQLLAAEGEAVDQAVDVEIRSGDVDRCRGRAVQLQEHADPLAGLGWDLRRLRRGGECRDHVELPSPGDLRAPCDVNRAQLDRRPGQRADDGRRVGGVGEQAQPGEEVADLGPLEERRLADQPVRHGPLLERHRHGLTLGDDRGDDHRDPAGRHPLARDQPLDVRGDRLGLRALALAAPERHLAAGLAVDGRPGHERRGRRRARAVARATNGAARGPSRSVPRRPGVPRPQRREGAAAPRGGHRRQSADGRPSLARAARRRDRAPGRRRRARGRSARRARDGARRAPAHPGSGRPRRGRARRRASARARGRSRRTPARGGPRRRPGRSRRARRPSGRRPRGRSARPCRRRSAG